MNAINTNISTQQFNCTNISISTQQFNCANISTLFITGAYLRRSSNEKNYNTKHHKIISQQMNLGGGEGGGAANQSMPSRFVGGMQAGDENCMGQALEHQRTPLLIPYSFGRGVSEDYEGSDQVCKPRLLRLGSRILQTVGGLLRNNMQLLMKIRDRYSAILQVSMQVCSFEKSKVLIVPKGSEEV